MYYLNLFFAALFLFLASVPAQAQTEPDYVIAVLRADGIVEPFAAMHDSTWNEISRRDLNYLSWQQTPFYFYSGADSLETLHIGTPVVFDPGGMNSGDGFISSYSNSSPGQNCCFPKSKAGLVLNWENQPSQFMLVDSVQGINSPEESRIRQLYRSSEQEYIDEGSPFSSDGEDYVYPGVPVNQSSRDTLKIGIGYQITDRSIRGKRYLYFSASRAYPVPGCGPNTGILQGWAILHEGGLELIKESFAVGDCDGKGLGTFIEPHLAFELYGKVYIGATLTYYEGEGRQLYEVLEDDLKPLLSNH